MNLAPRAVRSTPVWCVVGATVWAVAPTIRYPILGTVTEIEGVTVSLRTPDGMVVAVDVEDCRNTLARCGV